MELREYLTIGRRWMWLLLLATGVAAAGAWVATAFIPKTYMSQTTLMVGRPTDNPDPNASGLYVSTQLATTYATMVSREPVLQGVVDALHLDTDWQSLQGMIKAAPEPSSPLIIIRVVDVDPGRARAIADEVANQLINLSPTPSEKKKLQNQKFVDDQIGLLQGSLEKAQTELRELDGKIALETSARAIADLQGRKAALESQVQTWNSQLGNYLSFSRGGEVNSLSVIESASPGLPVGPNVKMNVLLAAAIGFGLALASVLVLEYLDDTVKTPENLAKRVGVPGLATIERVGEVGDRRDGLVTVRAPRSPTAEAFRVLRTNLQFTLLRKPKVVLVVTSANPGEGKSTVSANLAVAVAQGGKRVILVDSDLRRPTIHRFFDLSNHMGMTSLILDEHLNVDSVLRPVEGAEGLQVLTSGPLPPNPAEVLGSAEMDQLLEVLKARADVIILDSPPLLAVADAAILAGSADGTLLVFDSSLTRIDAARRAVDALRHVEVTALGAVVNKLDGKHVGGHYYRDAQRYSGYYQSAEAGDGDGPGPDAPSGGARTPAGKPRIAARAPGLRERVREAVSSLLT